MGFSPGKTSPRGIALKGRPNVVIIPKDSVRRNVESDSMAFQKLTKLFLIRKFAVMLGLIGNVGGNGLYARLAD
jgi:hypothetical protein